MIKWAFYMVVLLTLGACQAPNVVVVSGTCGAFALAEGVACERMSNDITLLQSNGTKTITYFNAIITIDGLLYARETATGATFIALRGVTVFSANNTTRQLSAGTQLMVNRDAEAVTGTLGNIAPYDEREILALTPSNPTLNNSEISQTTPDASGQLLIAPANSNTSATPPTTQPRQSTTPAQCATSTDWTGRYTVQRGDVLSRIAGRYGVSLEELIGANCLTNPDRIRVSDVLRVPNVATLTPPNAPTLTPSAVAFRADKSVLAQSECTVLRWDVFNVSAVFIDETPTTGNNILNVCPTQTTIYTLRIMYPDGTESTHITTLTLSP